MHSTIGRFHIVGPLGRGGMGEVYRATDTALGRDVALKILPAAVTNDPDRLQRFEREARAASALNHPHLISIYDIGRDDSGGAPVHYIAMELVEGQTLRDALGQRTLDLAATLDYLAQAADALAAAHGAGVIHRDLKPENLMIAASGYVKVLDFGLAKLRGDEIDTTAREAETRAALTTPGMLLGTAGYMSPEQAQGRASDHRSDIFSFGCILYEAVAGHRAFEAPSFVETLARVIGNDPAPLPSTIPPSVRAIVARCLAKNPADRYDSMRDVAADLRRARRELEPGAPAGSRGLLARVAIPAAILAAVVAGGWWAWRATRSPALPLEVQQLTASGNVIDTTISPDGRYLAWVESTSGMQGLWVRQVGGNRDVEIVPAARVGFWGIAFSPDGRSIYYTTRTADRGQQTGRLFVIDALGGTPRPILDDIQSAVTFSPDGRQIAFLRAAFPQPNMVSLIVAGADGANPRALATRTSPETFSGFFAAPSWSPDGARIVAPSRNIATAEARLVVFDAATGAEERMQTLFGDVGFTAWLPDGAGILTAARAYNDMAGVFQKQIWLQPYPAGEARRITNDDLDYRNAWVTRDGRQFAAVGERVGGGLWRVPINGDPPQRIRSERFDGRYGLGMLPDGRMVIHAGSRTGDQRLEIVTADGANRQVLTDVGTNIWPAVSPDGQTIVFMSNRSGQTGVWRVNADGTGARMLTAMRIGAFLSVTPDGRSVILSSPHEGIPAAWSVPMDGGPAKMVARSFDRATPSPDGKWLAGFHRASASAPVALAVMPIDGSAPPRVIRPVPPATGFGLVEWAKDGQSIIYTTAERINLFRQPLAGGDGIQLTTLTDLSFTFGDIAPDGLSVIASRGLAQRDAYLFSNFR